MGVLRFLLALSVIVAHSSGFFGMKLLGGQAAVQAFFVISGFYMALILAQHYKGRMLKFYINRFLRIYPLYWAVIIVSIIINLTMVQLDYSPLFAPGLWEHFSALSLTNKVSCIIPNLILYGQDIFYFLTYSSSTRTFQFISEVSSGNDLTPAYSFLFLSVAWSLAIEEIFYLTVPWLSRAMSAFILLFIASVILRIVLIVNGLTYDPWSSRFVGAEFALFATGFFLYRYCINYKGLSPILFYFLLFVLVIARNFIDISENYTSLSLALLLCVSLPRLFVSTKDSQNDRNVGELSYPLYLIHLPVLTLLTRFDCPKIWLCPITLVISVLLAILMNRYIQTPVEVFRAKIRGN